MGVVDKSQSQVGLKLAGWLAIYLTRAFTSVATSRAPPDQPFPRISGQVSGNKVFFSGQPCTWIKHTALLYEIKDYMYTHSNSLQDPFL